jgi:hypothetical protein
MTVLSKRFLDGVLASIFLISFLAISLMENDSFHKWFTNTTSQIHRLLTSPVDADEESAEWVLESMTLQTAAETISDAKLDQEIWISTPQATIDERYFSCAPLRLDKPSASALAAFNEAEMLGQGSEAKLKYTAAAREGYWRAAERLVTMNLREGNRRYAAPAVAWLIHNNIPAGYNKMADLLGGGPKGLAHNPSLIGGSFRWRAALDGDPDALMIMAELLLREGEAQFAKTLRDCAERNRQTFGEYEDSPWDSFLQWLLEAGSTQ